MGEKFTEEKVVGYFTSIDVGDAIDVKFIQGDNQSVFVEGYEKDVSKIKISTSNGVLKIRRNNSLWGKDIVVTLTAPNLEKIQLEASSDFYSTQIHTLSDIDISLSTSSEVYIQSLQAPTITASLSGSSELIINKVVTDKLKLRLSSSSDSKIHVERTGVIDASLTGSSDLRLSGDVEAIYLKCTGSSDANVKNLLYQTNDFSTSTGGKITR